MCKSPMLSSALASLQSVYTSMVFHMVVQNFESVAQKGSSRGSFLGRKSYVLYEAVRN